MLAIRVEALRPSLERLGRFDPVRARERFAAGFAPEYMRHIALDGVRVGFITLRPDDGALQSAQASVLKLEHLYRFAAVPTGLNLQKQEPFELFSSYTQAQAVVLKKLILQESKTFTTEAYPDCNDLYETGDVFGFITWYLTPEGLIVQPSFPHVAAVCEGIA